MSIVKKTVSFILILAVAAAVAFATPLKAQSGYGDAKVYDSNYKAVQNPSEISDNYVIRTSTATVFLSGGPVNVKAEANSMLQFISLEDEAVFYLLDGRAIFSSKAAFEVKTPVTVYKAEAGTALYVITEDAEETAFVDTGLAEATNLITGEVTQIGPGTYIDNAKAGFQPTAIARDEYWRAKTPAEQPAEAAQAAQPAEEAVVETTVTNLGALEHTFSYRGIRAVLRAYIGIADLEYPEFVTNEEIDAAARAAVLTFPETLTQDITYEVVEPGLAQIYYPESYGKTEFDVAVYLIDQELPGYIDALLGVPESEEQQVAEEPAPAVQPEPEAPAQQEQAKAPEAPVQQPIESRQPKAEPAAEPVVAEEPAEEAEEESFFKFGATIGFIYGHGDRGDYFADPMFLHERVGVFLKNYMVIVNPVLSFGDLKVGLHFVADFRSGKIVNPLDKLSFKSATGVINGVMQFVSLLNYTKGNFSINIDRTSDLEFRSPIYTRHSRNYDTYNKLQATMNYSNGAFGFSAFIDDLELNAKLQGHSQFAGARVSYLLGKMEIGLDIAADFGKGVKNTVFYPGGDAVLPFTIKDVDFALEGGAVAAFPLDKAAGKAAMIEGKFSKTSGMITFGVGAAYSVRYNFNDIINNGPTSVIDVTRGKSIDVLASFGFNVNHFRFTADVRAPFAIKGDSRLVYNTVRTKYGNTATITADTMNLQADVFFGKFTFTAGAVFNGFAGRVADLLKAIKNREGIRAALGGIIDPEISTIFAKAEFAPDFGDLNLTIYARADIMTVKSKIAIPLSAGVKVTC